MVHPPHHANLSSTRAVHDEPLPGYRLIEPLGRGGFGEVWKCSAPGGLTKAIKFVRGESALDQGNSNVEQELRALEHIKSIRHPFLLTTERVEVVEGDLVIVMELADRSLHDLLTEYRQKGQAGIPRWEVLSYLREAAEVLDLLNQEFGVKHLDIKPRNIFLVGKHIKVADFGLAGSLADLIASAGGRGLGGLTPLYAAPETFGGKVTLFSDQYSLAATYHELVTGEPVFKARNYHQLVMMVCSEEPDLAGLPPEDRPAVKRALSKEPRDRYPNCTAFLDELDLVGAPDPRPVKASTTSFEFSLNELATTPGTTPHGSGVFRRKSRLMPAVRPAPSSPQSADSLSGYQLLDSLGRGPAGELWRARGPGGQMYLVRFVTLPGGSTMPAAIERLLSVRHPTLARMQSLPAGPDRVALISDLGTGALWERFRACHATGMPGVPRAELLTHLARFADSLDQLYHQHEIQHLMLTPRHLALANNAPVLLEFGMAELLWLPHGLQPAQLSPRYSACEMFEGLVSDACDQYSLALIYQELLVGLHPFRNLNARQMASPKLRGAPDVALLPGPDRAIVLQALAPEPDKRFRSCREFVLALEEASAAANRGTVIVPSHSPAGVALRPAAAPEPPPHQRAEWRPAVEELVTSAGRGHEVRAAGLMHYRVAHADHVECRALARLQGWMTRLKMDGFVEQWRANEISRQERRFVCTVLTTGNLWDRCLGRLPGLQVEIRIGLPEAANGMTPVRINLQPVDCNRTRAEQLLSELGPTLLGSLQTYFHTQAEKAAQERYPLNQPVKVQPAGEMKSFTARLRDIGREGLCLVSAEAIPQGPVTLTLNRWASAATVQVPGRVVDCLADDKQFEVEVRLG